jgi:hypothetical protein
LDVDQDEGSMGHLLYLSVYVLPVLRKLSVNLRKLLDDAIVSDLLHAIE